ncbi:MAG TPA: Calx-beta domain-containing protein, partial [Pyrinomonadaceae bacterium]
NVTIATNGLFQSASSGTQTGHVLTLSGNLVNNGVLDFSTNTAGAAITFSGATSNSFSGTGPTTDLLTLTINKGSSSANILELMPSNFSIQGVTTDVAGFLTITNGTLKLSGNFAMTNRVFTTAAYSIPVNGGFWLNNPNFTVTGQAGSPTTTGLLRISQGTLNIGTVSNNSMGFATGSNVIVEGGTVNVAGRFGVTSSTNAFSYTQTGGVITVCTAGNTSTALASFDMGTSLSSTISISGGTLVHQLASTAASGPRDYRNQAGAGAAGVTGGAVQFGNAASGAAKTFNVAGILPNLVIDNTSANHSVNFLASFNFNHLANNVTINTGTTLNIGNNTFLMNGPTLTNNGTLTGTGALSNLVFSLATAPVNYTGSGVVTAPLTSISFQADQGVTISATSPNIVTAAVRLFTGNVTNANKLTLGNGGSTSGVVQIGNTQAPSAAGSFDVPFTFNLGSGGQTVSYLRTTTSRTTGPEINPTRNLTALTYDNNDPGHSLTIAGGDLNLTNAATALTLTNGRIVTGANTLSLTNGTGAVSRTNGYVDGNLRKTFAATTSKTFEVGTVNGFSPATVNVTAGTFPGDVTVKAIQGKQPNLPGPNALQRYWQLTAPAGFTTDLTMQYLASDVVGNEANYLVYKYTGTFSNPAGSSVNTATHQIVASTQTAITADWTAAEAAALLTSPGTLQFSANNYSVSEAIASAVIRVTRTGGSGGPASVNFATASGTAVGGSTCAPGVDFINTSGTLSWTDGDLSDKTFNISICSDSVFENDETVNLILTGASLGMPSIAVLTITNDDAAPPPANAGDLVISEFRFHGPTGANNTTDEFIEIYNRTGANFAVAATDGPGFSVAASDGIVRCIIPNGLIIPVRGHFLCANSTGYSLESVATPDATYSADIPDADGIALYRTAVTTNFSTSTRLDAVGFNSVGNTLYKEGSGLSLVTGDGEYSLVRKYLAGMPVDTDDNANDFVFVSTDAGIYGTTSQRGAPGPESLSSPIENNVKVLSSLIDNTQPASAAPNRVRDTTPGTGATALGTLDVRRKFTNNSGQTIDTLRFRIVELTTTNTPAALTSPQADLRVLTSGDTTANGGTITIVGSMLEAPSDPVSGGGFNSAVTVSIPGGLAAGASINVRFLLGVAASGSFKFYINAEPTGAGVTPLFQTLPKSTRGFVNINR